jgi:hypothetical protein
MKFLLSTFFILGCLNTMAQDQLGLESRIIYQPEARTFSDSILVRTQGDFELTIDPLELNDSASCSISDHKNNQMGLFNLTEVKTLRLKKATSKIGEQALYYRLVCISQKAINIKLSTSHNENAVEILVDNIGDDHNVLYLMIVPFSR